MGFLKKKGHLKSHHVVLLFRCKEKHFDQYKDIVIKKIKIQKNVHCKKRRLLLLKWSFFVSNVSYSLTSRLIENPYNFIWTAYWHLPLVKSAEIYVINHNTACALSSHFQTQTKKTVKTEYCRTKLTPYNNVCFHTVMGSRETFLRRGPCNIA